MTATNWIAITGAPSSGKTSVIDVLAARGYKTQGEAARAYIEEQLSKGLTLDAIRGDSGTQDMQHAIFTRMQTMQAALDPTDTVFLDRGLPDSIAYFQLAGMDATPVVEACRNFTYRAVFILDRLPVTHDDVRTEDDVAAQQLGDMFKADYEGIGYHPVAVPVMPVNDRVDFILTHLQAAPLAAPAPSA